MDINCKLWNLSLMINTIQHLFCVPFRMALRPMDEIAVILENFQCMLHSIVSAVRQDTDVVRMNRFRLYLLITLVPITTLSHNLGLKRQDVYTTGASIVVCEGTLGDMIQMVGFLHELEWTDRVISLLNRFINEK